MLRQETPRSPAMMLAGLPADRQKEVLDGMSDGEVASLMYDWRNFNARPDQIAPVGDWEIWLALSGRGWGKTRTGAEWVREEVAAGRARRIAFIAETAADCRDVMVEGNSGILSIYPDHERPVYEPSKRRVTWPNGAVATLFNAREPDQLRGPQFDLAWSDELAKWRYARKTWDQLQFGLRLGDLPRQIVTTTPRPIELIKAIVAGDEGRVAVTVGHTLDNAANLASKFLEKVLKRYEGTRLGRQELQGQILGDVPNALWTQNQLDLTRVTTPPKTFGRIVVAVDPGVTDPDTVEDSDDIAENGIIVAAASVNGENGYVLEDASMQASPKTWARRAIGLYEFYGADAIVVEVNNGGAMVTDTVRSIRSNVNIVEVRASRGKHIRAEPISALYEQGRIGHVGNFPELEQQMTMMTTGGYTGEKSPDRCDALVWAFTELFDDMVDTQDIDDVSFFWRPRNII